MQQIAFRAMGCEMLAAVDGDSTRVRRPLRQVPRWFSTWEDCLSRFRPDSELNRLNRSVDQPTRVSRSLWRVLSAAHQAERESDGLVTPTVLPALEVSGYHRTSIEIDPDARSVTVPATAAPPTTIGVADPTAPERQLALLRLVRGGVATSGRDVHRWRQGGRWQHHNIAPRIGRPAETDVLSATAVAGSAREAEAGAKVALILGSRAGIDWKEAHPHLAALLVRDDGQLSLSRRFAQYLWRE